MKRVYEELGKIYPKEAETENWKITRVKVDKHRAAMDSIKFASDGFHYPTYPGTFVVLGKKTHQEIVMSDSNMEKVSNLDVIENAHGNVLIAGLGLGMILIPILKKKEVKHVVVVEKEKEVIDLVLPYLMKYLKKHGLDKKLGEVMNKDIHEVSFDHKNGFKWNTIYFDIWSNICTDNLKEIRALKKRFRKGRAKGCWVGAWMEDELKYQLRRKTRYNLY